MWVRYSEITVSVLTLSILSPLTWYNQSEVCAARTSDRRLCLSTLHFGGPSTAAWPDRWCPLCARASCGGARLDLSWISQPAKIQFSNTDHREKSLSGAKIFFFLVRSRCAEAFSLLLTGPQLLFYSHSHCLHGQSNQLRTWTKENEAMWPVRVRAQSLQRLNGPADQKGRLSSLKTSALKRAAWQLPALAIWTAVANNREQQLGSRADGQCSGLAYAWYADLARGQHMAGRHSQAAVSTVSLARSHHQYL